jgi:hypothetical protein
MERLPCQTILCDDSMTMRGHGSPRQGRLQLHVDGIEKAERLCPAFACTT